MLLPTSRNTVHANLSEIQAALLDCPLFDAGWYHDRYDAVRRSGIEPLAHFITIGATAGLRPCPSFDTAWYIVSNPQIQSAGLNPLWHFLRHGRADGLRPNCLFDTAWYLATYQAASRSPLDPLSHFLLEGWQRGCRPNVLFDTVFYLETYPEAGALGMSPLDHFIDRGAEEGRCPNPFFDTTWYLGNYVDARTSALDPLSHFLTEGAARDFQPNPLFDTAWYRKTYLAGERPDVNPLAHFIARGAHQKTCPNPLLDLDILAERNSIASRAELFGVYRRDGRNICAPAARARGRRDREGSRLLFLDALYPRPNADSGSLDTFNHLRTLSTLGFAVTFVATAEFFADHSYRRALEKFGVDCADRYKFASVEAFLTRHGETFDVFVLSRVYAGGHFFELAKSVAPEATFIFNTVDLHHVREEREAQFTRCSTTATGSDWTRGRELYLTRQCHATIVVSSSELDLLRREEPGATVALFPLLREIPGRNVDGLARDRIGFLGNFGHRPNVDAVAYFLMEIWPALLARSPDLRFEIVGDDVPENLRLGAGRNVVFMGQVDDLNAVLARWRVSVAPLRFGAGAKGKVVSSLAYGVPCVASPLAVEGMALEADREITVAADAPAFVAAVNALVDDEVRWKAVSRAGLEAVRRMNDVARAPVLWTSLLKRIGVDLDQ